MHAVELLSGPSLAFWGAIIWSKLFVLKKQSLSQNTMNIGVSAHFSEKKGSALKFEGLLSGPSWPFPKSNKLGPDNNSYLDQKITPPYVFCLKKRCWNTYFYSFFQNINQILAKKWPPKTIACTFCKIQVINKRRFVAVPLLTIFKLVFFLKENIDVEIKHNLKSGNKKRREQINDKTRQKTPKTERIEENKLSNWMFWCSSFMNQKQIKRT